MRNDMRQKLRQQLIEQHGKIVYSHTIDEKEIFLILWWEKFRKIVSIILSAITVSPAFLSFFDDKKNWEILSAVAGVILLCISTYNLKTDNSSKLIDLRKSANKLWEIREKYNSLLTDFDDFNTEKIRNKRDELIQATSDIYSIRPKSSYCAYLLAQIAIKKMEEQTFNTGEAERLLPNSFRDN